MDAIAVNVLETNTIAPYIKVTVESLRASLADMHHDITITKDKQTNRNKNNQRGALPVNFHVADYVLWSRVDAKTHDNKLAVKWIGPHRVISANVNSFEIERLLTGATRTVHASHLKRYADSSLHVNEEILEHVANYDIYLTMKAFKQHRKHQTHSYKVLVGWEGLEDIEDSWEPIKTMHVMFRSN
ncbi:unnamed protein product [Phytophthora fragariaefolia]|uniref:Unnamed protein product n=1 Tax=Phytophthora fragariaefolia TaxID=1490495 RepID=A0A9W7D1E9_9STRA|nr:unnamed protein product [Phytophthora fragariaefolia]